MKNKIIYVILIVFVLLLSGFLYLNTKDKSKVENDTVINTSSGVNIDLSSKTSSGESDNETSITLDDAITGEKQFKDYFKYINVDFNYSELVIQQFKKVKSLEDFNNNENKFGPQVALFTFLKLKDRENVFNYFDYHIEKFDILSNKGLSINEFKSRLSVIIDSYFQNGYYDGDVTNSGSVDIFLVSLISDGLDKKLSYCDTLPKSKIDDFNNCVKIVTFMSSTKENGNCDKLKDADKKWCLDTLKLIK